MPIADRTRKGAPPSGSQQDDKALHVVAPLDDLQAQPRYVCHRRVNLPGVIAAIGPYQFEPREAPANFVENQPAPPRS